MLASAGAGPPENPGPAAKESAGRISAEAAAELARFERNCLRDRCIEELIRHLEAWTAGPGKILGLFAPGQCVSHSKRLLNPLHTISFASRCCQARRHPGSAPPAHSRNPPFSTTGGFMRRRSFLKTAAAVAAATYAPVTRGQQSGTADPVQAASANLSPAHSVDISGHTLVCEFQLESTPWKVYEDLRSRDGAITFLSAAGARVLGKSAEASFAEEATPYLALPLKDIGTAPRDLLAER